MARRRVEDAREERVGVVVAGRPGNAAPAAARPRAAHTGWPPVPPQIHGHAHKRGPQLGDERSPRRSAAAGSGTGARPGRHVGTASALPRAASGHLGRVLEDHGQAHQTDDRGASRRGRGEHGRGSRPTRPAPSRRRPSRSWPHAGICGLRCAGRERAVPRGSARVEALPARHAAAAALIQSVPRRHRRRGRRRAARARARSRTVISFCFCGGAYGRAAGSAAFFVVRAARLFMSQAEMPAGVGGHPFLVFFVWYLSAARTGSLWFLERLEKCGAVLRNPAAAITTAGSNRSPARPKQLKSANRAS